jgi:hypothetical protein
VRPSVREAEDDEVGVGRDLVEVLLYSSAPKASGVPCGVPPRTPASEIFPSLSPFAPRKRGTASAKMKTKMKRTLRMMKRPPKVITPVAPRSTSLTRAIRLEAAAIRSRTPIAAVAMGVATTRASSAPRPPSRRGGAGSRP